LPPHKTTALWKRGRTTVKRRVGKYGVREKKKKRDEMKMWMRGGGKPGRWAMIHTHHRHHCEPQSVHVLLRGKKAVWFRFSDRRGGESTNANKHKHTKRKPGLFFDIHAGKHQREREGIDGD
jgi:hypothetical protein